MDIWVKNNPFLLNLRGNVFYVLNSLFGSILRILFIFFFNCCEYNQSLLYPFFFIFQRLWLLNCLLLCLKLNEIRMECQYLHIILMIKNRNIKRFWKFELCPISPRKVILF